MKTLREVILEDMKLPSRDLVKVKITNLGIKTTAKPWRKGEDPKEWFKHTDSFNISLGFDCDLTANINGKPKTVKTEINADMKYLQYNKRDGNVKVSFDIKGSDREIFDFLWILGSNAIAMNIRDALFEKEFDAALSVELGNPPVDISSIKKNLMTEFGQKLSVEIEDKE